MSFPKVAVFDTTLRDGEQTPGVHLTQDQKVVLARALEHAGVDILEAGFPASSPGDAVAVDAVAAAMTRPQVAALARCVTGDIEAAARALARARQPVIHLVLGVSDIHLEHKLRLRRPEAIRCIESAVRHARGLAARVEFSLEDATRADPVFVRQCVDTAICAGATVVNIADTVGSALPGEFGDLIGGVVVFVAGAATVSAHCHDDLGLAVANTLAAVRAGARQVEVTVNGIGERAGNCALEQVAVAMALKGVAQTGIQHATLAQLSAQVAGATGVAVQPNRPIVGANAFAHSSGIHQDGILKHAANYTFVPPEMVGVAGHRLVLTARSGRRALAHVAERHGIAVSPEQMETLYAAFLEEADRVQGAVAEAWLTGQLQRVAARSVAS
jgi:2-isopropylmalate synthase